MIGKSPHIRNPLTVIATFAGTAEVCGTVVLPFVPPVVQEKYVMFLMAFPCLLVLLFFFVLWFKHGVLYAPSDFKDDGSFFRLFNLKGFIGKVVDTAKDDLTTQADVQEVVVGQPIGKQISLIPPAVEPDKAITVNYARTILKNQSLHRLGAELGSSFIKDVALLKHPGKKFDFVTESAEVTCVGTVFYSISKMDTLDDYRLKKAFSDIHEFWKDLSRESAKNFVFAAVVIAEDATEARRATLRAKVKEYADMYKFETLIKVWDASDLSGQPLS